MAQINFVIEGKYKSVKITGGSTMWIDDTPICKRYVSSYTIIDESNKEQYSYLKGALGAAFFGGLGVVAGIGGKSRKEYLVAIEWKDGDKSLILIDEEHYKVLVKSMF